MKALTSYNTVFTHRSLTDARSARGPKEEVGEAFQAGIWIRRTHLRG